jgi:uncharacterized iron-regulated membrane protein
MSYPAFTLGEKGTWSVSAIRELTHTKALGQELYSAYLLPFEIAGLILLVALIGGWCWRAGRRYLCPVRMRTHPRNTRRWRDDPPVLVHGPGRDPVLHRGVRPSHPAQR